MSSFTDGEEESGSEKSFHDFRRYQSADVVSKLHPPPPVSPKRMGSLLGNVTAVVCGDLGGTNSRLELFRIENVSDISELDLATVGKTKPLYRNSYKNDMYKEDFTQVMHQFLEDSKLPHLELVSGCLAVAGPVENDRVNFTNLNWAIDSRHLEEEFFMPENSMRLVNDFVANGFGVVTLDEDCYEDLTPLGPAEATLGAPVVCVGAGTGLGETFATSRNFNNTYDAWPSEGGHVAFAPRDELQRELLTHLSNKFQGRVSTERVVSGKGIVNVYEFLAEKYPELIDPKLDFRIRTETEGAALVSTSAYDNSLCNQTMDLVLDAYGAELGNAAVKWIPRGGLYIAGGIAVKNVERLRDIDSPFMKAYLDRGRLKSLLPKIPLRLVTIDDLGLRGAHYVAITILAERNLKQRGPLATSPPRSVVDEEGDVASQAATHVGPTPTLYEEERPTQNLAAALDSLQRAVLLGSGTLALSLIAASIIIVSKQQR